MKLFVVVVSSLGHCLPKGIRPNKKNKTKHAVFVLCLRVCVSVLSGAESNDTTKTDSLTIDRSHMNTRSHQT